MITWFQKLSSDRQILAIHVVVILGLVLVSSVVGYINDEYRKYFFIALFAPMAIFAIYEEYKKK